MNAVAVGMRAVLWAAGLSFGVLLLASLLRQPLPPAHFVALGLFALLALVRPVDALLLFAALGPLSAAVSVLFRFPFGGTRLVEALALLLLVPWILRQGTKIRTARWRTLHWALLGFAALVVASAATHLPAVALRTGTDSIARALWEFFTQVYLEHPPGFDVLIDAVLLLEGLALCALVFHYACESETARRLAGMLIAGATGAALLNVYRVFEIGVRGGSVADTIATTFSSLRLNTQFADLNAAGSYFALALVGAAGMSDLKSARGKASLSAVVPLAAAVWLSGSRAALAAAALGILAIVALSHKAHASLLFRSRRQLVTFTAIVVALVATLIVLSQTRNNTMRYSVFARAELTVTAFRMLSDRPVLGVGISRFYELFPQYASPQLRQAFYEAAMTPVLHENAHNNFLQILAELGILGFAAFLLVLWGASRPDRLDVDPTGIRIAWVFAIATFLLTGLFGHPLLTREVAYPFWMALGLAAAGAPDVRARSAAVLRVAITGAALAVLLTVPSRANYERRYANMEGVAVGMSSWQRDAEGNRFRWAGVRSALFVESWARIVRLPLRAAAEGCSVEIWIDRRLADRVTIPSDFWQEVRLRLPSSTDSRQSYRVDLIAGENCAGRQPDRERTLMVGRPEKVAAPSTPSTGSGQGAALAR